jgi:hypothetical protein
MKLLVIVFAFLCMPYLAIARCDGGNGRSQDKTTTVRAAKKAAIPGSHAHARKHAAMGKPVKC